MKVQLSETAQRFVSEEMMGGKWSSPEELVEEALSFYHDQQPRLYALRDQITKGIEDEHAGRFSLLDIGAIKRSVFR